MVQLLEVEEVRTSSERGVDPRRVREISCVLAMLILAALLRIVRLDQNGYGNTYYSAAVRSMLASFSNFFFGSFDPLGLVTVDKPPVALWIQALSAKILGFSGLSILLPQAILGTISVWLTYKLVRKYFGFAAAIGAGVCLAITPIGVAIDRDNLPDPALGVSLLLAAWALLKSIETTRPRFLFLSMALVGLGFNIKMLAAFVVLPTFYLVYLIAASIDWRSKVLHLALGTVVLVATSLSWAIAVELTPKSARPYIGGSRGNSALELALGYNGIARVMGMGGFGPPGGGPPGFGPPPGPPMETSATTGSRAAAAASPGDASIAPAGEQSAPGFAPSEAENSTTAVSRPTGPPPFGPGRRGMPGFGGTPGLFRFTLPTMAGQITWLFPLAILGILCAGSRFAWRLPVGPGAASLVLWSGWLGTHWLVFSFAQGIFHEYYTYILGPALAAMTGIGLVALWREFERGGWRGWILPAAIVLTTAWHLFLFSRSPEWGRWLAPIVLAGSALAFTGLLIERLLTRRIPEIPLARAALVLGVVSIAIGPAAWSLTPVIAKGNSMMPTADPGLITGKTDTMPATPPFAMDDDRQEKLLQFLTMNNHGEPIILAAPGSMEVSGIITRTGKTAISLGGFMGGDRVLTKEQLAAMVDEGRVRFFLITPGPGSGGPPPGFGPPPSGPNAGGPEASSPPGAPGQRPGWSGGPPPGFGNAENLAWIREHGKVVDAKLWKSDPTPAEIAADDPATSAADLPLDPQGPPPDPRAFFARMRRETKLYDCKPELGLIEP